MYEKDTAICSSFIKAARKLGQFPIAEKTFLEAIKEGYADEAVYNTFIDAAGKANRFDLAKKYYDKLAGKGPLEIGTHNAFIGSARRAKEFALAEAVFKEVLKKKIADNVTYHLYIDALVDQGKDREAALLFLSGKLPTQYQTEGNSRLLDLQNHSHGSGYIAVRFFIASAKDGV